MSKEAQMAATSSDSVLENFSLGRHNLSHFLQQHKRNSQNSETNSSKTYLQRRAKEKQSLY